jgi:hypothetical protein
MRKKVMKPTLLATIVTAVLLVGTVSARQLRSHPTSITFCRGTCSATVHCSGPCFCWIPDGATTGGCVKDPPGLKALAK